MAVPDSNPRAKSFRFEAMWDGAIVLATAVVTKDQVALFPVPGKAFEIPLEGFADLAAKAIVAAHTRI